MRAMRSLFVTLMFLAGCTRDSASPPAPAAAPASTGGISARMHLPPINGAARPLELGRAHATIELPAGVGLSPEGDGARIVDQDVSLRLHALDPRDPKATIAYWTDTQHLEPQTRQVDGADWLLISAEGSHRFAVVY